MKEQNKRKIEVNKTKGFLSNLSNKAAHRETPEISPTMKIQKGWSELIPRAILTTAPESSKMINGAETTLKEELFRSRGKAKIPLLLK